jgi:plasmid maintenance system antidote protein VapI
MKTNKLTPVHPGEILREEFMKPRASRKTRWPESKLRTEKSERCESFVAY